MIVAIHPDDYTDPKVGKCDASSPRWAALLCEAGHEVRWVDVYRADILEQLRGCHGLMWRWGHNSAMRQIARRLLPVAEQHLGLVVYPDQNTCWHFDDKIAQAYLFESLQIPSPKTWVWFDAKHAMDWAKDASYPLVLKLASGAGSTNVHLVQSRDEACGWIQQLFGEGVSSLSSVPPPSRWPLGKQRLRTALRLLLKGKPPAMFPPPNWDWHKNYVLFQEFLANNAFDTRITVIGNRAFGYRRFNRPNDFRASGSGNFDPNPDAIDLRMVRLAFEVAQKLGAQSVAMDGLCKGEEFVITEVSYAYVSWMVHDCPGYWEMNGETLRWQTGQMWPEEAQVADFLQRLNQRKQSA